MKRTSPKAAMFLSIAAFVGSSCVSNAQRFDTCQPSTAPVCDGNDAVSCGTDGFVVRTTCPAGCTQSTGLCVSQCGNGQVNAGETCDDGNTTSGDGCRADCTIERCGDGIVDRGTARTEECDDGNVVDTDGCDAMCRVNVDRLVNTTTVQNQTRPAIAVAPDGRALVVWEDASSGNIDVRAQLYASDGSTSGTELVVNTITANNQSVPRIAANNDGVFLVVWQDASGTAPDTSGTAIRGRRLVFNAAGVAAASSDFLINTTTANDQRNPTLASATDGSWIVAWENDAGAGDLDVRRRVVGSDGTPQGTDELVNETTLLNQNGPAVVALSGGRILIVWQHQTTSGTDLIDIKGRLFSSANAPIAGEQQLNTVTAGNQTQPAMAASEDDGVLAAWTSGTGATADIVGRKLAFTAAGTLAPGLANDTTLTTTTTGEQSAASTTFATSGSFVVTWQDQSGTAPDASGFAIRARRFTLAGGASDATDFVVDTTTPMDQTSPAVAWTPQGVSVFVWQDASDTAASGLNIRERRLPKGFTLPLARP